MAPAGSAAGARDAGTGTIAWYEACAEEFWRRTRDHDVAQNIAALLGAVAAPPPLDILDLGCGPGRDLKAFAALGHRPVGLDGVARFVAMAREYSGCPVLHQDFLALDLPAGRFHGIFANASLFHVPRAELPRVLGELRSALRPAGVLFASNPHGNDEEGWNEGRFGSFHRPETWRRLLADAGFELVRCYFRPEGLPRDQQPWFASVWRKPAGQGEGPGVSASSTLAAGAAENETGAVAFLRRPPSDAGGDGGT